VVPPMRHRQTSPRTPLQRHSDASEFVPWNPPDSSRERSAQLRSRPSPARCRFRSPQFKPRSTGRCSEPPAASSRADRERTWYCRRPNRKAHAAGGSGGAAAGGGRSEVKRRRAGASRVEPRTESPSEAAQPKGVGAATSVTGVVCLRWPA
jgi:hypothetical protein